MRPHCSACPLDPSARCPSELHPSWCKNAERERLQADPRQHYWIDRIRVKSAELAGLPAPKTPPPPFPPARPPDGRPRVGVLSPCCGLGGADLWVGELLARTDRRRIRWEGVAIRPEQHTGVPTSPEVRAMWEETCPLGIGDDAVRELAARCDLLVGWGIGHKWGFPTAALAPLIGRTPLLQVSHGAEGDSLDPDLGPIVVAGSAVVSYAAVRGLPGPYRRDGAYRIMSNLVAPERVTATRPAAETRRMLGIPDDARVAGWLGRFSDEKRPGVFIEACALLPDNWIGVMAGNGWRDAETRELAAGLAPGRVLMVGPRYDVGDVLNVFDVLCMPSRSEAASLSAMEAWLSGTPLVSCRVGMLETHPHLARIIPNPPTGKDLADAILTDEADWEGTRSRVEVARVFAAEHLSPERFGDGWTGFILDVSPKSSVKPATRRIAINPAVRDAVNSCECRGPEGGLTLTPEEISCCGGGDERTACSAMRGARPGRVTLRECLACKSKELAVTRG